MEENSTRATLDLDAIEARANAATPGPWMLKPDHEERDHDHVMGPDDPDGEEVEIARIEIREDDAGERDGAFIAAARADVPALIARVRELEGVARALAKAARAAVAGIEPIAASVDDLLCDLKRAATVSDDLLSPISPATPATQSPR